MRRNLPPSATSHHSALLMTSLLNNTFEGKNKLRLSTGSIDASGALLLGKPMQKQRDDTMFDDGWSDDGAIDAEPLDPMMDSNHIDMPPLETSFEHVAAAPTTVPIPLLRQTMNRAVPAPKVNPLALLNPHDITSTSRAVKKGKPFTLPKPRNTKSIFKVNAAFAALYAKTRKQQKVALDRDNIEEQWVEEEREIQQQEQQEHDEQIFNGFDDDLDMDVDDVAMDEPEADLQQLIDDSLPTSHTFESLCRQHLQSFLRGAEEYAKETNLSRRVSDWTARLEPILAEQEARPEFDMHSYSDKALQRLSISNKNSKSGEQEVYFKDIVGGETRYEVCRLFLACLQLGNLGNISFQDGREVDVSSKDLKVKLISDVSNRLNIENYRAPSVSAIV